MSTVDRWPMNGEEDDESGILCSKQIYIARNATICPRGVLTCDLLHMHYRPRYRCFCKTSIVISFLCTHVRQAPGFDSMMTSGISLFYATMILRNSILSKGSFNIRLRYKSQLMNDERCKHSFSISHTRFSSK